jgi:TonB family protein
MPAAWKLAISIALFCASGAASTQQSSSEPKPGEYTLEPIETSEAVYPPAAKEQRIQGRVVGMILVSETGGVESVQIFKNDPLLTAAAEEAAKKWKFKPVLKDGKPVPVIARATFNFVLSDNPQGPNDVAANLDRVTDFPQQVRVSSGVMQAMVLRKVSPSYPEKARKARIQGTVMLHGRVNKDGTIADLQVVSGPEALVPAAMEAVRQWQYRPYLLMGRPVDVETELQVNFTLSDR